MKFEKPSLRMIVGRYKQASAKPHMNEFTERFKSKSNVELLNILDNPTEFQKLAVEAASSEISNRNLSDNELNTAKEELLAQKQLEEEKTNRKKEQEKKIFETVSPVLELLNPLQRNGVNSEKLINGISLAFLCIWAYQLFKNFALIQYIFTSGDSGWDFSLVMFFLPIMYMPFMTYLFWKKKSTGWILLSIYLTYSAVSTIGLLIMSINSEPSGIPALDSLFPTTPTITYVLTLVFYCGTLWTIAKERIRGIFTVNNRTMYLAIGITAGISGFMVMSYF
ncbi:MAG: hypothetical protein JXR03_20395 [Cyclobacteriaceae bacterium]